MAGLRLNLKRVLYTFYSLPYFAFGIEAKIINQPLLQASKQ
ncbi:hypothetical protein FPC840_930001 [Flavobacterium psychrophilum]|nr:hypothetical protein FPC840_930001 [Flavobacterium psychrophilum]